ncbi:MAG: DUF5060 domain-containing protein, partial [Gorillibacterium sp.]|nr:DUF5060 domain-containing protein [Gorillibacterium sp.]
EQIDLGAKLVSPSGKEWGINGFFDGEDWKLRFSPDESGKWTYKLHLTDMTGQVEDQERFFQAVSSDHHGWIEVAKGNQRFLQYRDGSSFFGIGVAYPWEVTEGNLDKIAQNGGNLITYWNGNYDNTGIGGGNEQLESMASGLGKYDVRKGKRIDELLEWFEERNLNMSFVIWPHDSLADNIEWPAQWDKNAYSTLGAASDFYGSEAMWKQQEKLYRYMIARWGHSRSLGIWDLICEVTGTDGYALGDKSKADEWLTRIHGYFNTHDPYNHPTMGSAAGNAEDYWEHAYKTLDLADRENYYSLNFSAYAEDIAERWKYGKPLMIGETGNVTDATAYHNVMWVTLANGLASSPIWWDFTKVDDSMYAQMKMFSAFVTKIDFAEQRVPVKAETHSIEKQLPHEAVLEDGKDLADWSLPDWATANKDDMGTLTTARLEQDDNQTVVRTDMTFAGGDYSQGVLQQKVTSGVDWSGYDYLTYDVFVNAETKTVLKAKAVLFPKGQWTEAQEAQDVLLVPGQWTTVQVKLAETKWLNRELPVEELQQIESWALKVYANSTPATALPTTIKIRNPRLVASIAPIAVMKEAEAWLMKGTSSSYGWMISETGSIARKTAAIPDWGPRVALVEWYDPWDGKVIDLTEATSRNGKLTLKAPPTERSDLAFTIRLKP